MKEFIINKNDSGQRVDKFLQKAVKKLPKSMMYKYIRTKRIKVNSKRCEISQMLNEGDVISLYINDEFFQDDPKTNFLNATDKLSIVYEDENIILVDKKQGMVVHEDDTEDVNTLINSIKNYLYKKGEYNPDKENSFAPALCNRIDRNTGGIVICAKNAAALRVLNQKIKDRELTKLYLCVCVGSLPKKEDTITHYLKKNEKENRVYISDKKTKDNLTITTKYKVLKTAGGLSLVEVDLKTGRTHQIRAHMAYIGNPLLGDGKYGRGDVNKKYGQKHQLLYSYKLIFSFKTDAECLNYLKNRAFSVEEVWFKKFF